MSHKMFGLICTSNKIKSKIHMFIIEDYSCQNLKYVNKCLNKLMNMPLNVTNISYNKCKYSQFFKHYINVFPFYSSINFAFDSFIYSSFIYLHLFLILAVLVLHNEAHKSKTTTPHMCSSEGRCRLPLLTHGQLTPNNTISHDVYQHHQINTSMQFRRIHVHSFTLCYISSNGFCTVSHE